MKNPIFVVKDELRYNKLVHFSLSLSLKYNIQYIFNIKYNKTGDGYLERSTLIIKLSNRGLLRTPIRSIRNSLFAANGAKCLKFHRRQG